MRKKTNRILCAIMFIFGAIGTIIETCRLTNYGFIMTDKQWMEEILMLILLGTLTVGSAVYAVAQQYEEV